MEDNVLQFPSQEYYTTEVEHFWINRVQTLFSLGRPPRYVEERLLPLYGLCTYTLLEGVRYGELERLHWDPDDDCGTMAGWFGELRAASSEWGYRPRGGADERWEGLARRGMLSHQWRSAGEELLALDRAVRVPRDAPQTQQIYRAVTSVPEYVVRSMSRELPGLRLSYIPIGSFPSDAKIIDIDEFDFLLIHDEPEDGEEEYRSWAGVARQSREQAPAVGSRAAQYGESPCPEVTRLFRHGPAWCVLLSWRCHEGHAHEIGVDFTFSRRRRGQGDLSASFPLQCELYRQVAPVPCVWDVLEVKGRVSSVELDLALCRKLAGVSDRIMASYRLLKLFTQNFLPKNLVQHSDELVHSLLDSHSVKLILFEYLYSTEVSKTEWTLEKFHEHLLKLLEMVDFQKWKPPGPNASPKDKAVWQRKTVKTVEELEAMGSHRNNLQLLSKVIRQRADMYISDRDAPGLLDAGHIYTAAESGPESPRPETLQVPQRVKAFVVHRETLYWCDLQQVRLYDIAAAGQSCVYALTQRPMLYTTHPLMYGWRCHLVELYRRHPGPDLSQINVLHFGIVWTLHVDGVIPAHALSSPQLYTHHLLAYHQALKDVLGEELFAKWLTPMTSNAVGALHRIRHITRLFPGHREEALGDIYDLLPRLSADDRACLALVCRRGIIFLHVVDADLLKKVHARRRDCALIFTRVTGCLGRVFSLYSRVWVQLQRYNTSPLEPGHLLAHTLSHHMLTEAPGYLAAVTPAQWSKAGQRLDAFLHEPRDVTAPQGPWSHVAVERDGRGLFRAVAEFLHRADYSRVKAAFGVMTSLEAEIDVVSSADRLRRAVVALYGRLSPSLVLGHPADTHGCSMGERAALMAATIRSGSHLEVAAVSHLVRRPVHVYERTDNTYTRTNIVVMATSPNDAAPITLLVEAGVHHGNEDICDHYDYLRAASECSDPRPAGDLGKALQLAGLPADGAEGDVDVNDAQLVTGLRGNGFSVSGCDL